MTRPAPWTIAVADAANPANPSIAYVTNAHDRQDAIARVHAHHSSVSGWAASRILTVTADPGTPPVDAWYGWTDLRGIKALRLVLEPAQVRRLARLRLRLRRWNNMMDPHPTTPPKTPPGRRSRPGRGTPTATKPRPSARPSTRSCSGR